MKKIDVEELKKIQMEILDYFDSFCKRHDIHYWLDYGTLLGAVRHKGYIPWDDDLDIGMLREDYQKAAALFNKESNGLFDFSTPDNNRKHRYPFGKITKTDTVLYEYGEAGIKSGVYVDVFPYDNCPKSEKRKKRIFARRTLLGRLRRLQLPMRKGLKGPKKLGYIIGSVVMKLVPVNTLERALDKNARQYESYNSKYVCEFVDPYDAKSSTIPKKVFQNLTELEFEKKYYPAPVQYDYWLKTYYGDYMELPPEKERVSHHVFEAYYISAK